jgi:ferredoxin
MKPKKIVLHFSQGNWDKPIVYRLIKDYNLVVNILKAEVLPRRESYMVVEITGLKEDYQNGLNFLEEAGVKTQPIGQDVNRNDEICTHCGACTAVCPTGALSINRPSMTVDFKSDKCSACALCVPSCPPQAMEVSFR